MFHFVSEDDVTKTEYNGFFRIKQISSQIVLSQSAAKIRDDLPLAILTEPRSTTKINLVCEALLKAMLPETKKYDVIIQAYLKYLCIRCFLKFTFISR